MIDWTFQINVLKAYKTELKRVKTKVEKGRCEELQKIVEIDKELENLSYGEIQDDYGWGNITQAEFEEKAKQLEEYHNRKDNQQTAPTLISNLLKLIQIDIVDIEYEIDNLKYDMLSDEEKLKKRKKTEEVEYLRKKRLKDIKKG